MPLRTRKKQLTFTIPLPTFSTPSTEELDPRREHRRSNTTDSNQTDASDESRDAAKLEAQKPKRRKAWYKRFNLLNKSRKPLHPTERTVSREYGASLWSLLTFRWMSPLMAVSARCDTDPWNDLYIVTDE